MTQREAVPVWWLDDGKPGHRNQSLGLLAALQRYRQLDIKRLQPQSWWSNLRLLLRGGRQQPAPRLLLGAGHATHLSLCCLARVYRAPALVLMKPSLPLRCFAAAIVPRHDGVAASNRVLITEGVLNRIIPRTISGLEHDSASGLMLIGGESRHYHWSNEAVLAQIQSLVTEQPDIHWHIADSRRTPAALREHLHELKAEYHPHETTDSEALNALMQHAGQIKVSPDSVSMLYEALTSGARVSLFELPPVHGSKVATGIAHLAQQGRLAGAEHAPAAEPFWEADRAARWLLAHFAL